MKIIRTHRSCPDNTCPTVHVTDRGTVIVQGYLLDDEARAAMSFPVGEDAVEMPFEVAAKLARETLEG
jgi:hypothetical protein